MNHHESFRAHLEGLSNFDELLEACRKYKTNVDNFATELNGRLKGGLSIDAYFNDFKLLQSLICATFNVPTTLYRITTDFEFSAPTLQVLTGRFQYQPFMSTASSSIKLGSLNKGRGRPLLLEIECPAGIALAPLDQFSGTDEDEILLGCGTTFELNGEPRELNPTEISAFMPMYDRESLDLLPLRVAANPPYVAPGKLFTLRD